MHRTAHFETSEPEEWSFDENEEPSVPGGAALAHRLRAGLEVASLVPRWLLGRRTRHAFTDFENAVDALLRRLPEVSALTWV